MKSLIKWRGGKGRMVKKLLPMIPPHTCYVEPFAGGAALFFAKERSEVEVLNDLHGDLVNLFRIAQFHPHALEQEASLILSARQNLKDFIAQPGLTDLQRAARWLARNWMSFSASCTSFGVQRQGSGGAASSRSIWMEKIRTANARLDRTIIENLNYDRCLELYDSAQTFFFCDPPYEANIEVYAPWKRSDFQQLRAILETLKGQWVLTVNNSPDQRETWAGLRSRAISTHSQSRNQCDAKARFGELIVLSPNHPGWSQ